MGKEKLSTDANGITQATLRLNTFTRRWRCKSIIVGDKNTTLGSPQIKARPLIVCNFRRNCNRFYGLRHHGDHGDAQRLIIN
jgi:hypothetical protein